MDFNTTELFYVNFFEKKKKDAMKFLDQTCHFFLPLG